MARILLRAYYGQSTYYNIPGQGSGYEAIYYTWEFETETKQVAEYQTRHTATDPMQFETNPGYSRPATEIFFSDCIPNTFTRRDYYHNPEGGLNDAYVIEQVENSTFCGYADIQIEATVVHAVCFGSNTGSITLAITQGAAPYTYLWNDGVATKDRPNVKAGNYSVTVSDSAGNSVTKNNILVNQNSRIQVVASVGNNSIELQVAGGIAPYTFLWSDGETTQNRYQVATGEYSCTVTDSVGCTNTFTFLVSPERFYFSKNPVLLELQALSPETKSNLRFLCEVWIEPEYLSGDFINATPEPFEHPADSAGSTVFDVSEILDAFVEPHLPDFNQAQVSRADRVFRRFFLRYTEAYGEPVTTEPFTIQENRYVVCGGLDAPEHYAETYFNNFKPNRKPFFTWEPVEKLVLAEQPEYLYFMPELPNITGLLVFAKVTFADASTEVVLLHEHHQVNRFEVFCIPVSFTLVQPLLVTGKIARSYDIFLYDQDFNIISETRRFVLDYSNPHQTRYFLYANSLGGYNTLAATGKAKLTLDTKSQLIERNRPINGQSADAIVTAKHSNRTLQLSTGFKRRNQLLALQDFLNSEDVRLVGSDRYIPGRLADKSAEVMDESENMLGLSFSFLMSKMHRYTPSLRLAGYTDETASLTPLEP